MKSGFAHIQSIRRRAGVALVLLMLFWAPPAGANQPSLVNVEVSTSGKYITMNALLVDGFNSKILEAIESGMPVTFTFEVELRKMVSFWADNLVRSNTIRHTIQYDSLKKVYRFSEVGRQVHRKAITRDKARSRKLMAALQNIPLVPYYRLDPKEKYYVRIKADFDMDRFWFPFNYIFFFVPFNDFETSWAQSSPLSIDPEWVAAEARRSESRSRENDSPKVLNHVLRSFNQ